METIAITNKDCMVRLFEIVSSLKHLILQPLSIFQVFSKKRQQKRAKIAASDLEGFLEAGPTLEMKDNS